MKSTHDETQSTRRQSSAMIAILASLLAVPGLVSCGTSSSGQAVPATAKMQPSHWFKVSDSPPTYFPKGVAPDHPTDFRSGEWVSTCDAERTRFFIPLHGLAKAEREALRSEALAARNPALAREAELQEAGRKTGAIATAAVIIPTVVAADIALSAFSGTGGEFLLLESLLDRDD
jgi:hypothetical protein